MDMGLTCDGCSTTLELEVSGTFLDAASCDLRDVQRSLPRTVLGLAMWLGWECVTTVSGSTDKCPACRRKP